MLQHLKFLTAGESHGKGLTGILEGFPAGLAISEQDIDRDLARRQAGHGRGGRMKIENDHAEILSGVRHGMTIGSPIALWIRNRDWDNWKNDIMSIGPPGSPVSPITLPRPGHADLAGSRKFGFTDIRNVLERSSARETAMRVALGAVCRIFLEALGIRIASHVLQIGEIKTDPAEIENVAGINQRADESPVRCLNVKDSERMVAHINETGKKGDSLGGVFEVIASGVPTGLGSYTHWDRKLDARLSAAMISINAMKAVSFGDGHEAADLPGSEVHDEIIKEEDRITRASNHAGGIEGGMSNGENIRLRVTMKPIPTLTKPLRSVDLITGESGIAHKERTDVCAVPAAAVVGEAMMALILSDAIIEKFGGDSLDQIRAHMKVSDS